MTNKRLMRFSLLLMLGFLSCGTARAIEQMPPEKAVVIEPNVLWVSSSWAGGQDTKLVALDESGDYPRFVVAEADRRHVWTYYFTMPFDPQRYPIAVLTYRAHNTHSGNYLLWLDDTRGPNAGGICPFSTEQVVADGTVRELRADLRKLKPKAEIIGMALGVFCGKQPPAEFELIGLRFKSEAEHVVVQPIKPSTSVSVRVVDQNNNPVEGATVTVDSERSNWSRSTSTDKNGQATLTPLANRSGRHTLRISKTGMATVEAGDRRYTGSLPEQVTLRPALQYGGIVQNEQDNPVESVAVSILITGEREPGFRARRNVSVFTDAKGCWQTPPLPDNLDRLVIRLAHPDYVSDPMYGSTAAPPIERLRDQTGIMILKRGVEVVGFVVDAEGKPISGAHVKQGRDRWGSEYPHTYTNEQGRFRFANSRLGEMILTVQKGGFGPAMMRPRVQANMEPLRFVLEKGRTIRGRVIDARGEPVAGARAVADAWRECRAIDWSTSTNSEGRFTWTDAPADEVLFDIVKEGYMSVRRHSLSPSDEEHLITLLRPLLVRGKVVDAKSGKPIEKFRTIPGIDWGRGGSPYWERRGVDAEYTDGTYELTFSSTRPGHFVRIEADGYLPAVSRSIADDEGEVVVDFKLEKGEGLAGVIYLPDGKPAAGAKAILATPSQGAYIQNGRRIHSQRCPTITTGPDAQYSFPPQVDPWCIMVLHDAGYKEVDETAYEKSKDIRLEPWGQIEGKLLIGSKLGANERITIDRSMPGSRDRPRVYHDIKTSTDQDGQFAFDRVPAGEVFVGRYVQVGERMWSSRQRERVKVEPGKTAHVQLGGKGRPVIGRVVKPAGRDDLSFANSRVSFSTKIDVEMNYPKPPERPADWAALDKAIQTMWQDEAKIWREGYEKWLLTEEGQAYKKAMEEAQRKRKHFSFIIQPDGSFRVEDVPAGAYQLRAYIYSGENIASPGRPSIQARLTHEFIVPEMPGGRSDEPLDLDRLELSVSEQLVSTVAGGRRVTARAAGGTTLVGEALPGLEPFNLQPAVGDIKGKHLLICFWDMEQRPSRRCIKELAKMTDDLAKKGGAVVGVHASTVEAEKLKKWLAESNIELPTGQVQADAAPRILPAWGVRSLPWLILTDAKHIVRVEGFPLADLDGKLKEISE